MTDKVNPSINRPAEAFKTAGAIALAGGADPGYVTPASSPSELSVQDSGISDTELNAFEEDHGKTFDVSVQDTSPQDVAFNNDGTLMYAVGAGTDSIYEYALSTAYDVSTASLNDSLDVSVSLSTPTPTGMAFNGNGTKLFVTDAANANVAEYALSTAYDVSTASLNSTTDVSTEDGSPQDVAFNNDGTLMYVVGDGTDSIYEYALSTAYDASTLTLNDSLGVGTEDATPNGMAIGDSGTLLYVIGASNDNIYEYALSTSYDVSTATLNDSFSVGGQDTVPSGITYFANGQDFVIIGESSDSVYKYALEVDWDISTATYADVVIDAGEAFVYGSWCAIDLRTTVNLAASTNNQTVYVGWNKDGTDDVIVGLASAFDSASGNTDQKIPLYDFDTDGSGVTNVTDRRTIGKTVTVQNFLLRGNALDSDSDGVLENSDVDGLSNLSASDSFTSYPLPYSDLDSSDIVVENPDKLPIAKLDDTESVEIPVRVPDTSTLEVYRWGAYDVSTGSAPTGLDVELVDGSDTVQASANTANSENRSTPVASYTNSSGSLSVFKVRAYNGTGSAINSPGVGAHFGFLVV